MHSAVPLVEPRANQGITYPYFDGYGVAYAYVGTLSS